MIVCEKCIGMAQTKPTYQYSWQVPGGGWERGVQVRDCGLWFFSAYQEFSKITYQAV
ncbi:hypothetical protein AN1816.2 [Aspergillus nidulans FGSC A4]|nr:hypothetical protein AN1816.2 [Aspergillus nidulans FGSC A4]|eukprot:XP_659420.1 hypothetical protein AN1816.2 [Aspergillus nidulans FGSC A4]